MDDIEKRLMQVEFKYTEVFKFVEKVANDSDAFVLMKKDIEECKTSKANLSETIDKEIDVYMNKPNNRKDLEDVILKVMDNRLNKFSTMLVLKVSAVVLAVVTALLVAVFQGFIR